VGLNRYYLPNMPLSGEAKLPSEEAHHAIRVRREKTGNPCLLFDGVGHEAAATFIQIDKREACLHISSVRFDPKVLPGCITLGVAMPKGDRQKEVIEKAVELGVHRIVPIQSQRSVSTTEQSHLDKWRRYVIESCKQCERNQLLEIDSPQRFADWTNLSQNSLDSFHWLAHPTPDSPADNQPLDERRFANDTRFTKRDADAEKSSKIESIFISVGPEGGFTDQEAQFAIERGWQLIDLGPRILRVETAVSMVSILAGLRLQDLSRASERA
jgi:16S rRNA (uracil1498-N3)-methyltransferase